MITLRPPFFALLWILFLTTSLHAEDGYRLWLRYDAIRNPSLRATYLAQLRGYVFTGHSPTQQVAAQELQRGLTGLLDGVMPALTMASVQPGTLIAGTPHDAAMPHALQLSAHLTGVPADGYVIYHTTFKGDAVTVIGSPTDVGVLYGVFHLLRLLQTAQPIDTLSIRESPRIQRRILNHWDNLDRTVERGYAGFSLWNWHMLPDYIDARYYDYARANASIGINGTVLTNVNANALVLTEPYLEKVKALADVFRLYGIRVYLTARFSAPMEIGGLPTADPLDAAVQQWWADTVKKLYTLIPDFGGFLVKANSEGQPGPQHYGRTHAEGANMLADALKPYDGIVMWRAFVYDDQVPDDRAKQAYDQFKPLDGKFHDNVLVQVKNGPIDFQPREPFHPIFGAMPQTPLMMEFQITQEYLGFATHLVYLAPLYKECLEADTYAAGTGSTVARVVDGSLDDHTLTGMAGVANIGTDRNWCGHPFAQANWYSFGRLAWDHTLTAGQIADEWIGMTFTQDTAARQTICTMMLNSRDLTTHYMTPLGLAHLMGEGHHYGPAPWTKDAGRADWTSVYYHRADAAGIGFDRTATGSNAVGQYYPPVAKLYGSVATCPDAYLLWFHHLTWDYTMRSGRTLWQELCYVYSQGADAVQGLQTAWASVADEIDADRFAQVQMLLTIQQKEARWWRDACLLYFQTFSQRPFPADLAPPDHSLAYYQNLRFPYAPGIRPRW